MNSNYNCELKPKYVHKIILLTCQLLEQLFLEASHVGDEKV